MPLPERLIEPVNLSRGTLQYPVPDELEGVTNGSLANIIRQLSSLSRHAEEMFGNLFSEAEDVAKRSSSLQARIDRLAVRVTRLDSTVEEVSLQDIHLKKAFRSAQSFDQQVVSRDTMPKAMLEMYLACDKPPPLDKLNPYRDDAKDGLKFYTDPTYFFELWKQEMLKDTERMMHDKSKKPAGAAASGEKAERSKKRVRNPQNTNEKHKQKAVGQGEYLMEQQQTNGGIIGYDPALAPEGYKPYNNHQTRLPNNFPPQQQQQQQQQFPAYGNNGGGAALFNYNAGQEDIYMPRILRSEQPSQQQQQQTQQPQQYHAQQNIGMGMYHQQDHPLPPHQMIDAFSLPQHQEQQQPQPQMTGFGSPTKRPEQPPPAPPPIMQTNNRDSVLPSPPPPPPENAITTTTATTTTTNGPPRVSFQSPMHHQNLINQINSHLGIAESPSDLPPPPPVPVTTTPTTAVNNLLSTRVPVEHLPPSPPPPPPVTEHMPTPTANGIPTTKPVSAAPAAGAPAPPPPPPPPPPPGPLTNGVNNGIAKAKSSSASPVKTNGGSPPKSQQGLKKPAQPFHMSAQDGVRSDLLKAIRDGIALKKVEQKKQLAKDESDKTDKAERKESSAGQQQSGDVASILARRVAVEMSDSDAGHSDSEYDSDEWGDESTA